MSHTSPHAAKTVLKNTANQAHTFPAGHPHELLSGEISHHEGKHPAGGDGGPYKESSHGGMFSPGQNVMPHKVAADDPQRFYAREKVDPLCEAFEGKITVHPGMGGIPVMPQERGALLDELADTPCQGRKLAYIHVPFCETHCLYCSFFQNPYGNEAGARYVDTLVQELEMWRGLPAQAEGPVHAVYLGGGTPTALQPETLGRLLKAVNACLPLANDCEFTLEGRAANLTPALVETALENGVNRFSLGVQSFSTDVRQAMGRTLGSEELIRNIELVQSYDQASVIIDLIYGLPGQSMAVWMKDLATAQSLNLDGLDCYQLGVHKGAPLARAIAHGQIDPAAGYPQMGRMFAASVQKMESYFYRRLSVNHWSRTPRERSLYNIYTRGGASCLGFGPGAGGNLNGHMTYNPQSLKRWQGMVKSGRKPVGMLLAPTPLAELNKALTEGLEQCRLEIPVLEAVCSQNNYKGLTQKGELRTAVTPLLEQWQRAGLLEPRGESYVLTVAGQFWYVNLTQLLIEYIDDQH